MKVFVTIAQVDGKIQSVYVWKSKRDARNNQRVMVEAIAETVVSECAQMDNEGNALSVLELRLKNSSVHMIECNLISPTK